MECKLTVSLDDQTNNELECIRKDLYKKYKQISRSQVVRMLISQAFEKLVDNNKKEN